MKKNVANITHNKPAKAVVARIVRGGELYSENFGLATYQTWEAAEAEARKWVKTKLADLPSPIPVKGRKTKRNSSGIVGVQLKESSRAKNGNVWTTYSWQAFWPGKPGGCSWAIAKYGNDQAFVRAAIARRLETSDRRKVEEEFQRVSITPEYREILKKKAQDPP